MRRTLTKDITYSTHRGVVIFLVACCAVAWATQASSVTLQYTSTLRLPASIHGIARPWGVSFEESAGEICVTDVRTPAIHVVNRQGVATFRTSRFSGLSTPLDAVVTDDGSFVLLDRSPGGGPLTIRRLNLHGEPLEYTAASPYRDWTPSHLIVCRDGGYLTLDSDAGRLVKHDPVTGAVLWRRAVAVEGEESDTLFLGRPVKPPTEPSTCRAASCTRSSCWMPRAARPAASASSGPARAR